MKLYTIGFTKKSARRFFELIKLHNIDVLVDVRLNNKSQLAGFTKEEDLEYFLSEICKCRYYHNILFAPTKEILDSYKKNQITWDEYVKQYEPLIEKRKAVQFFLKLFSEYDNVCLLCSEPTPEHCHRRLLAEMIKDENPSIDIMHL